jgi:hypothetical protein
MLENRKCSTHNHYYPRHQSCGQPRHFSECLGVLPGVSLGVVRGQSVEAETLIAKSHALNVDIDLPWADVGITLLRAGEKTTGTAESAEALTLLKAPALELSALWDGCRVCLSVALRKVSVDRAEENTLRYHLPKSASLRVDVDLLTAGHNCTHAESLVAAGEVGARALRTLFNIVGAVGGGVLADPDLEVIGGPFLEMDGGSRASCDDAEELC